VASGGGEAAGGSVRQGVSCAAGCEEKVKKARPFASSLNSRNIPSSHPMKPSCARSRPHNSSVRVSRYSRVPCAGRRRLGTVQDSSALGGYNLFVPPRLENFGIEKIQNITGEALPAARLLAHLVVRG